MESTTALKNHPNLKDFIDRCQKKFPDDEDLDLFLSIAPEYESRVQAAREIKDVERPIVRKVIKRIFEIYPYEAHHDMAVSKATRDVHYVCLYANLCMLLGEPDWLKDKLLFWMRTILQSFQYPDILPGKDFIFNDPENATYTRSLQPGQKSIYECYLLLKIEMEKALSPDAYKEIEPYLQTAVDVLAYE